MLLKLIRHRKKLKYCFEALWDLAICKYLILHKPFQKYATEYGYAHCETLREDMQAADEHIAGIKYALRVVPRYLPWSSKCLDQAMAGQQMLKRRGLQSTLYFGLVKGQESALNAHAWLRCGDRWIIGYQTQVAYTVVGAYACFSNA